MSHNDRVLSQEDWLDPQPYFDAEEAAAMGAFVDEVMECLGGMGRGYDRDKRFGGYVVQFTGKDSDLEPWGCQGITSVDFSDLTITINYGAHKTVCPPSDADERYRPVDDIAQEIVSGAGYWGEWTGDEWVLDYDNTLEVDTGDERFVNPATGEIDAGFVAEHIYAAIMHDIENGFERDMIAMDEAIEGSMRDHDRWLAGEIDLE